MGPGRRKAVLGVLDTVLLAVSTRGRCDPVPPSLRTSALACFVDHACGEWRCVPAASHVRQLLQHRLVNVAGEQLQQHP